MKKEIIFGIGGFLAGVATGVAGTILVQKYRKPKADPKILMLQDIPDEKPKKKNQEEEFGDDVEVERIVVTEEEMNRYKEFLSNEGYPSEEAAEEEEVDPAELEYPSDDDPEEAALKASIKMKEQIAQYEKEHEGKIELMTEDEWDTDFPEEDYKHEELWYFPGEDVLTDEDGYLYAPHEKYVGDLFDKTRFRTNNWEVMYVRNHPLKQDFKIHKETQMDRAEFFY